MPPAITPAATASDREGRRSSGTAAAISTIDPRAQANERGCSPTSGVGTYSLVAMSAAASESANAPKTSSRSTRCFGGATGTSACKTAGTEGRATLSTYPRPERSASPVSAGISWQVARTSGARREARSVAEPAFTPMGSTRSPRPTSRKAESVGVAKARSPVLDPFVLGVLAGAFIALGAVFATTVAAGGGGAAVRGRRDCSPGWPSRSA